MIKKIAFNFFLHSKKGFKKYLRENGLTKIREKIANLHNMYVFDSDEKIFDEPKKKIQISRVVNRPKPPKRELYHAPFQNTSQS